MAISNTTTATTTATMAPTPSTQARLPLSKMQLIGLCVLLAAACLAQSPRVLSSLDES